jgi:uncharacterized membrane protein YphA (DoxX/SURF4 family)
MFDRRRYIGTFAVVALVFLRLVVGWHFFREGTQKIEYDRRDGSLRLAFSAEGFFNQAKGPLAGIYHSRVPYDHGWRDLLAAPRRNVPPDADESAKRAQWVSDYAKRQSEAVKNNQPAPVEFPPFAPYADWANQIADDWRKTLDAVKTSDPNCSDAQKKQADASLQARLEALSDYLAGEAEAITEYRHELWRLNNWRNAPEAEDVPFYKERIATKTGETASKPGAWVSQVKEIDAAYRDELEQIFTAKEKPTAAAKAAYEKALADPRQSRIDFDNVAVTVLTIGVGICLVLGLFTRLAALAGALFLLSVVATQPFWLADSAPTINQWIEMASLLVIAGTGAGRWAGLDYFSYAFLNRFRRRDVVP